MLKAKVTFLLFLALVLGFILGVSFMWKAPIDRNIDIIVSTVPYEEKVSIYAEPDENSEVISELCGQTCLSCNLYSKQETVGGFAKVELLNGNNGYIKLSNYYYDTLCLKDIEDYKRRRVCETAIKYLGTSYKYMQCTELIRKSFLSVGIDYGDKYVTKYDKDDVGKKISREELQPGDLVFYRSLSGKTKNGHIGLYLGQGYVIQSTLDEGGDYPTGGVRLTKLDFRSNPTSFRNPF